MKGGSTQEVREGLQARAGESGEALHGSHVVEGMVQLLTDGFVLQFLCV